MKKLRRAILVAGVVGGLFIPTSALGDSSTCNSRGDCVIADRQGRAIILKIRMQSRGGRYELCISAGARRCMNFQLERRPDGSFYDAIRVGRDFPVEGPGRYRAIWRQSDEAIGSLLFRIR